jgi:hypothetical protein
MTRLGSRQQQQQLHEVLSLATGGREGGREGGERSLPCTKQLTPTPCTPLAPPLGAGLVFLAFGFNWVDVGGLLGGRLDDDIVRTPVKASGKREVKRAQTM